MRKVLIYSHFGEALLDLRGKLGLSEEDIADMYPITIEEVRRCEACTTVLTDDTLQKIVDSLQHKLNQLEQRLSATLKRA